MTERPILFNDMMVRAILNGEKIQTRRVVKPIPPANITEFCAADPNGFWGFENLDPVHCAHCPYGDVGDRLWVREAYAVVPRTAYSGSAGVVQTLRPDNDHDAAIYRAGWPRGGRSWRPSIFMPRWASRIQLTITEVRVARVQEISTSDALREGVSRWEGAIEGTTMYRDYSRAGWDTPLHDPRESFRTLWDSINAKRGFGWDANPWVWVVSFEVVS